MIIVNLIQSHFNLRLFLIFAIALALFAAIPVDSQGASPTSVLAISAPPRVELGQAIEIKMSLRNAADVAGFEANMLFDGTVAEFDGLHIRDNDMKKFGRDMGALISVHEGGGATIGFYSCPFVDCSAGKSAAAAHGASGNAYLATARVIGNQPGQLEVKFDAMKFVDSKGKPLAIDIPSSVAVVQVGSGGARHPAPSGSYKLATTLPTKTGPFNVTGRKTVSQADVAEMAVAWKRLRQVGSACGSPDYASFDVNHDGCVDVADIQMVAANYTPIARVANAPTQTWVVNSTGDLPDINPGDGICQTAQGNCTLRAAIQEADLYNGPTTIAFGILPRGLKTIFLTGNLPTINNPAGAMTIDGYTQPGAAQNTDPVADNAVLKIQIQGNGAGPTGYVAFTITTPGNRIRGLSTYNMQTGIYLTGTGATNNVIVGNFIGTNAAGTFVSNVDTLGSGVHIDTGSSYNQIGNTSPAERNVISGNPRSGVDLEYNYCNYNVVYNNIFGLNPAGTKALPNTRHGVDINSSCSFTTVGGTQPGQRNVISGNGYSGVNISHDGLTTENKIIGNYVGTDLNGNGAGDPTKCGSYYTANKRRGIYIEDGVNNNFVANNVVGNNILGGIDNEKPNTVANTFINNRVGIGMNGNPIPNCKFGFLAGWGSMNLKIGPGNIIAYNQEGVQVTPNSALYNTVTQNSIYSNTNYTDPTPGNGRGIDLDPIDPDNPNAYDPTELHWNDYSNHGLNWPLLQTATPYQVTGTVCSAPIVPKPCTVEIYIAAPALPNFGQGKTFVGSTLTNPDGSFTAYISGVQVGQYLTASATDAQGDTSEFGQNFQVTAGNPVPTPTPSTTPTVGPVIRYAQDSFGRQVSNGWGSADTGGGYSLNTQLGYDEQDFSVNGVAGTMTFTQTQVWHEAFLPAVFARDGDVYFKVSTDKVDTTGWQFIYFLVRRVNLGDGYIGRLDFNPLGGVALQGAKDIGDNITMLGSEVGVPGLVHTAGSFYWVHGQVIGINPTTINLRAWLDGNPEPPNWQWTITDSEPILQAPGAVGLLTYLSAGASALPMTVSFESYSVTGPPVPPPTPTPTRTPTPILTVSMSPSLTPTATATATP